MRLWLWITVLLLAACQNTGALPPTATTLHVIQATLSEGTERALHAISSQTPGTAAPTEDTCQPSTAPTQHTINAEINYTLHQAVVTQHVTLVNRFGEPLNDVAFDVEANRFPRIFSLSSVTTDHGAQSYDLTGRRLTITLAKPLLENCTLQTDLSFILHVPELGAGTSVYSGYFGYSAHQMNLGQWLPMVAYRQNGAWIVHDVSTNGEQVVVEVADWDVTLTVSAAPPTMLVAAPGTVVDQHDNVWHYTLDNGRDFTLSLSPEFQELTEKANNNVSVELYTFGDRTIDTAQGTIDNAHQALHAAAQALALYSNLYGAFPYQRFVVVQGDYPDGTEFSGIVFVGDQWFKSNTGTPQSYLTIITVHETSHQWWYARVGSDQAINPWMDEALAVYSEYVFYEANYPDLKQWWWNYRVDSYVGSGYQGKKVDSSVYDFGSSRDYINAVYLRGAHMLDDLRQDVGTDAFFDWLKRYAMVNQNRVATPADFWSLLTPQQLDETKATRTKYLKNPQVIPAATPEATENAHS